MAPNFQKIIESTISVQNNFFGLVFVIYLPKTQEKSQKATVPEAFISTDCVILTHMLLKNQAKNHKKSKFYVQIFILDTNEKVHISVFKSNDFYTLKFSVLLILSVGQKK